MEPWIAVAVKLYQPELVDAVVEIVKTELFVEPGITERLEVLNWEERPVAVGEMVALREMVPARPRLPILMVELPEDPAWIFIGDGLAEIVKSEVTTKVNDMMRENAPALAATVTV